MEEKDAAVRTGEQVMREAPVLKELQVWRTSFTVKTSCLAIKNEPAKPVGNFVKKNISTPITQQSFANRETMPAKSRRDCDKISQKMH